MVPILSLAVPILVSAVLVFVASSIIPLVLPYHRNDLRRLPNEDVVLETRRRFNIPPGDYAAPHPGSPAGMKQPEFVEKRKRDPVVILTLAPGGPPSMGPSLLLWFLYSLVVSVFAAYIAGRALAPGAHYLEVFRFAGCSAFMTYSLALPRNSI